METRAGDTTVLLLAGLLVLAAPARAEPPVAPCPPVCAAASHSRLLVQPGRDVCAPTLANGAPVASGFLPTSCPPWAPTLVVDARGIADLCFARPQAAGGPQSAGG